MPWPSIDVPFFRRIPWGSLRVRLTLLNSAAVLLAMLILLFVVRVGVRTALFNATEQTLLGEVREVAMSLEEYYPSSGSFVASRDLLVAELRRKAESHRDRSWFLQLLENNQDGTNTVWASDNCPEEILTEPIDEAVTEKVKHAAGHRWARKLIDTIGGQKLYVRIGMPNAVIEKEVDNLTWFLLPIGIGFTFLTPLAGYWLALRATQPIAGILKTAEKLKPTKLGDRLMTRGTNDELDQLSATINRLLDQVARHVERQQQFVADAAHELRGPLAAMQNTLEVATANNRSLDSYQGTIEEALGETRHLTKLTNDLLLLAEVGNSLGSVFNEACDLGDVARQTAAMFGGTAEERSIALTIHTSGEATVRGDERQLRQVISNLVDNALRFTPDGGRIDLAVESNQAAHEAIVTVADSGRGVEPEHLDRVFDRFFQADAARDRSDIKRGGGLGLSICRSIIERHGGRISIDSPGVGLGATVRVIVPLRMVRRKPL
jgi:two-component system heavy metal sensor histidine kinase CusS